MVEIPINVTISSKPAEDGSKKAVKSLDDIKRKAKEVKDGNKDLDKSFRDMGAGANIAGSAVAALRPLLSGLAAAFSAREIIRYSDQWKSLQGRLGLVTDGTRQLTQVTKELYSISQRTRGSFDATASLYVKLAQAGKQLGTNQTELLRFSELVNKSFVISGANAAETASSVRQLSQAMASGVLRGDEFNSIMENAPALQQAIARELKVTSGELRAMAESGELSAKRVYDAILKQGAVFDEQFTKIPMTVAQAWQMLDNAMTRYIGQSAGVASATSAFAGVIATLAENFEDVADVIVSVGTALVVNYVAGLVAAQTASITFTGVLVGVGTAMKAAFPVLLIAAAVYAIINYWDELKLAAAQVSGYIITGFMATGEYIAGFGRGLIKSLMTAFTEAKRIVANFAGDLKRLAQDPFGFSGFSPLDLTGAGNRIGDAFAKEWGTAKKAAKEYGDLVQESVDNIADQVVREREGREAAAKATEDQAKAAANVATETGKAAKAQKDLTKAAKETKEEAGEVAQIYKDMASGIVNSTTQLFKDIIQGKGGFKNIMDNVYNIFADSLARMATLAIAKPILIPIIQQLGGAFGLGADTIGQVTGQLGGGGIGLGSIANGLASLSNVGNLSGTAVGGVIDTIGGSLGLSNGQFVGPMLPGQSAGISGAFNGGSALAGFAGSQLASLLGLGGGIGGSIGGTLGGLAGTAIGANMGTILGFAGGPAGALIGAFAGTALGGLFGGKKPSSKEQTGGFDFATGQIISRGGLTGKKFSQENYDTVTTLGGVLGGISQLVGGFKEKEQGALVRVNNRSGYGLEFPNEATTWYKTVNELVGGFSKELEKRFPEKVSDSLKTAIANIDWGTTEEELKKGLADLQFAAKLTDVLYGAKEPLTQYQMTIEAVNNEFDSYRETMERLKYSVTELAQLEKKRADAIETVRQSMVQSSVNDLLGETNPAILDVGNLVRAYQNQVKEFKAAGLDTSIIDITFKMRQQKLLEQINQSEIDNIQKTADERIRIIQDESSAAARLVDRYKDLSKSLNDALNNLRLSDISPLSAEERLFQARSLFQDTATRAALGDVEAMGELESIGNQFLELSRDYYASTDQFVQDFKSVEDALIKARDVATRQADLQQRILDAANAQIMAIQKSAADIISAIMASGKVAGSLVPSLANPNISTTASNANERLISTIQSGAYNYDANKGTIDALFSAVGGPAAGGGARTAFLDANPAANAAFVQAARAAGIPGFDSGGDVLANGLFMVGERRPEIYKAGSNGGKVIPLENGAQVEQRLESLEKQMQRQSNILYNGFKTMIDNQQRQLDSMDGNTRVIKRKSS